MAKSTADVIIVGQGLAGTALAWRLIQQGQSVIVVDAATAGMASHAAAGLITPITGKKLKAEPHFENLIALAKSHYRYVEQHTQSHFFANRPALRLLDAPAAQKSWVTNSETLKAHANTYDGETIFSAANDSTVICMPEAYRLDVSTYLAKSRKYFQEKQCLLEAIVQPEDVESNSQSVQLSKLGLSANSLVFCRGWRDQDNRWFPQVQWRLAKGQIIEVESKALPTEHTLHASGIWLTHQIDHTFLCGATYEWEHFDSGPDDAGATLLSDRLSAMTLADFNVVGQRAGVRPIVTDRSPITGFHDDRRRIALLNGLGSKGSLYAPMVAEQLCDALCSNSPIAPRFSLQERFPT